MTARALAALRGRTREIHRELESTLAVAAADAGREAYARHIAAMWGWLVPTEAALWRAAWPASIDAAGRAVKATWLEADIAVARADGFLCAPIPVAATTAHASGPARFGLAYVIEGSMLGGAALLKRLGARLAPWPARYLHGYGHEGVQRWQSFLGALDTSVATSSAIDEAADAAADAFGSIAHWMRACRAA